MSFLIRSAPLFLIALACAPAAQRPLPSQPAPDALHPLPSEREPASSQPAPLIDVEVFFADPEIAGLQISPDARYLSFRRPLKGVMNLWLVPRGAPFTEARPVTNEHERPIIWYFWSADSQHLVYQQDKGGDENYRLYAVDLEKWSSDVDSIPSPRDLTPFDGVRAIRISVPDEDPEHVLIGLNHRDPRFHDVYRLHVGSGELELVYLNDKNIAAWSVDQKGNLRLGMRQAEDDSWKLFRIDDDDLSPIYSCDWQEDCGVIGFHPDGRRAYLGTNRERNFVELELLDIDSGELELVHRDPEDEADFAGARFSRATGELVCPRYVGDRWRKYPLTDEFKRDYERVREALPEGTIRFTSQSRDDNFQLVFYRSDVEPGATYLYERESGRVELLYRERPDLPREYLARMESLRYTARDGVEIPAYLTLPIGAKPGPLPLVVLPHGGPWTRDFWGYNPWVQFLANRGYAVFQPNFRGSLSFGKEFLNLGNKEWGTGHMQHDITDGVHHLIEEGIVDADRIAIKGGSYGGFAVLAGLAFTPKLYAAGISVCGPSNIKTLLRSMPPYWAPIRRQIHLRVGDPDDPDDRERLRSQSPLFFADNIRAPLLVYQGANDPRVLQHESDQIVATLRDLNLPVQYLVAPDEGHGMDIPENRLAVMAAIEIFLAEHLGGRHINVREEIAEHIDSLTVDPKTVRIEAP